MVIKKSWVWSKIPVLISSSGNKYKIWVGKIPFYGKIAKR